jgi:hypothetical protein
MKMLKKVNDTKFQSVADTIRWVERKKNGTIKKIHEDNPQVGFTLIMAPYIPNATYQTNPITEIVSKTETSLHFKTIDSEYKLNYFD